jgi:hypothetical protein
MPHFKCVTCRTRLVSAGEFADVCGDCGSPYEPVAALTEIVGYRAIKAVPRTPADIQAMVTQTWARLVDEERLVVALRAPEADR